MGSFALRIIPILEYIFQTTWSVCFHALVVNCHRCDIHTSWFGCRNGVHVCVFFAEQTLSLIDRVPAFVPLVVESCEALAETISVATGQNDLWSVLVGYIGMQVLDGKLEEELI